MRCSVALSAFTAALSFVGNVQARAVFAHYMLGNITEAHAHTDIDRAIFLGIDAFALNIGDPTASFIPDALQNLFGYAEYRGFKLYVSLDVYASGDACYHGRKSCNGPFDYDWILKGRLGSSAWYKGPNGFPMVGTYSSGGVINKEEPKALWKRWKASYANQIYFIPDFDETAGYYSASPDWWAYWGDLVDGLYSWETAWPARKGFGQPTVGDVGVDAPVLAGARSRGKGYMIGLSLVQYKNSYGTNVYRGGDLNLPKRMEGILNMNPRPDFVQIQTWNDGPEGHHIGELWPEQNEDYFPNLYAHPADSDHTGLLPLFESFISAFKSGGGPADMASGATAVGSMWHNPILKNTVCPPGKTGELAQYYTKPDGWDSATDTMTWVVVSPRDGHKVRGISDGKVLGTATLKKGLNYGAFGPISTGAQVLEFLNSDSLGAVIAGVSGTRCVSTNCPDTIYNLNPQVGRFDPGPPIRQCNSAKVYAQIPVAPVDPPVEPPVVYSKCEGAGYPDMESIERDKANIEVHCMNYRIAQVLHKIAKKGLEDYEKLMKNDYQKKFDYYAKYILELAPPMVEDFMTKNASNYFDCYDNNFVTCCKGCPNKKACTGCGAAPNCDKYIEAKMAKCPTSIPHDSASAGRPNEVRYDLRPQKDEQLKTDLLLYQGIDPGWWYLGNQFIYSYKFGAPNTPRDCCHICTDPAAKKSCVLYYYNYPLINPGAKVQDPEDVFTDSLTKMRTMVKNLGDALTELYEQTFVGNTADVIRGAEYAVNFITQGVDSMSSIVETASEIAEIKKKEQISFIVGMITALIGFIPFAGTALRQAGILIAGRIITVVGEVTQVALNLYAFASDPANAGNIMFVIIDAISIGAPRWAAAAAAFQTFRNANKYGGLASKELTRAQVVDKIIVASFQFHG